MKSIQDNVSTWIMNFPVLVSLLRTANWILTVDYTVKSCEKSIKSWRRITTVNLIKSYYFVNYCSQIMYLYSCWNYYFFLVRIKFVLECTTVIFAWDCQAIL